MVSAENVKKAIEQIRKRAANYEYFFDRLNSPQWLVPLRNAGFFLSPPPPKREGEYISFPFWPESRYLARMAAVEAAQATVVEIAQKIPETENVRVHEDLADLALALPAALASQLVPKATKWLASPYQLLLPEKLGSLIGHLARGGSIKDALELARAVLAVVPDSRGSRPASEPSAFKPKPRAHFDVWHYEQILEKHLAALVDAAGENALWLLCDLLESAIRLSHRRDDGDAWEDYSWIWRPSIDSSTGHGDSIEDALVSAVRAAAERLIRRDVGIISSVVGKFESRRWRIFRRFALYVLHRFPESDISLVAERLCDPERLSEFGLNLEHEYYLLAKNAFARLSEGDQNRFLALVETGPDLEAFTKAYRANSGEEPSIAIKDSYRRKWQQARLSAIAHALPAAWRKRYEALVASDGKVEHPDFASSPVEVWHGPTSPRTTEELRTMNVGDLTDLLKRWEPDSEWMAPSREGLGRELSSLASASPDKFADNARIFKGLDPTYVRSVLSGLSDAAGHGRTFPWDPVLDLCSWVLQQPRNIPGRKVEPMSEDPDWSWTRKAIAELLAAGLKAEASTIADTLRTQVWSILAPLMDDPDPTPEHEARYGGSNMDAPTLALGTTRGQALHAIMQFALWVRRGIERGPDAATRIKRGFEEMPEVGAVLTAHLDPAREPSMAIRSIYGQWFPWLVLLDERWATEQVPNIFPIEQELRGLRDAAWSAYLAFCRPVAQAFRLLRAEYERGIREIDFRPVVKQLADPQARLAEHILILYWSGMISDLGDASGLLARFFATASAGLRGHALEFVGRNLLHTKGDLDRDILQRLQLLWEQRLGATKANPEQHRAELAAFGWWFASRKFSEEWAIQQLRDVLLRIQWAEPDHVVVERLADIAKSRPVEAVQCLNALIEGDQNGWGILGWREHATTVLRAALQGADSVGRGLAIDVIHRLGARGYREFRALLLPGSGATG